MKFIDVLHRGRRRRQPNPSLQEKWAWYSLFRPHPARDVLAAPQRPPVKEQRNG